MNGFVAACEVEARGMADLRPFLAEQSNGQYVVFKKGPMARHLQETVGDVGYNTVGDEFWTVEIKIEQKTTGNLFLESWSNKNFDNQEDHAAYGSNPGWLLKLKADMLWYYFLDTGTLYIVSLLRLKRWAFGHNGKPIGENGKPGRLWDFKEVKQDRYAQANDTWGRLVPVQILQREVKNFHKVFPGQIDMFPEAAA